MTRKLAALVITALLMLGLFPATAFAAATGTASLAAASRNVFPGDRSFSLTVNNTEAPLVGKRVNWVEVIYPVDRAGVSLPAGAVTPPAGWEATTDKVGSFQSVVFTAKTGIPTGGSQAFSLPASVARPASADRSGPFEVAISSDGGNSTSRANPTGLDALTANVRVLEVLGDLAPSKPAGVTDGSATGGQTIDYTHSVRNHALNALTVSSTLSSDNATDGVSTKAATVAADPAGKTPITHTVTLGGASADRTPIYTAAASATGAAGGAASHKLTVQQPATISLTQLSPSRVRSGTGANYAFEVVGAKTGTPSLNVTSGQLSFATTTASLKEPVSYTTGGGAANSKKILFNEVQVSGADGAYKPSITLTGTDSNDAPFSGNGADLANMVIDNLAPLMTIQVKIPTGQTAVKNTDEIQISGTISQAADDINNKSLKVVIVPNVGPEQTVTATPTNNSDGTSSFAATAKPTFDAKATSFVVRATIADTAGNTGGVTSPATLVDNVIPTLLSPGRTESDRTIRVTFVDNLTSAVAGGCDAGAYLIDGKPGLVETVTFQGETANCAGSDGTGTRILVLREAAKMDRDSAPSVTYSSTNRGPAKDGAANNAATQTIETVAGIKPVAPLISAVTRNNGSEAAYNETAADGTKTYFTRFAGTGTNATEDMRLTFSGARSGYTLQVLDGANNVLYSEQLSNPAAVAVNKEFSHTVRIPVGTTDGTYARKLRFLGNGLTGDATAFNVVLDRVTPKIGTTSKAGNDVTVKFSEVIVGGTDYAADWLANEATASGKQYYRAETVTQTDSTTRVIRFPFQNEGPFGGIDYRLKSTNGARYLDRAGNTMADTLAG